MAGFRSFKDLGAHIQQESIKRFLEQDDKAKVAFLKDNNIDLNGLLARDNTNEMIR